MLNNTTFDDNGAMKIALMTCFKETRIDLNIKWWSLFRVKNFRVKLNDNPEANDFVQ